MLTHPPSPKEAPLTVQLNSNQDQPRSSGGDTGPTNENK